MWTTSRCRHGRTTESGSISRRKYVEGTQDLSDRGRRRERGGLPSDSCALRPIESPDGAFLYLASREVTPELAKVRLLKTRRKAWR